MLAMKQIEIAVVPFRLDNEDLRPPALAHLRQMRLAS